MTTSFKEVTARELDPRSFLTTFVRNVDQELDRLLSDQRLIARRWWSLVTP